MPQLDSNVGLGRTDTKSPNWESLTLGLIDTTDDDANLPHIDLSAK